MVTRKTTFGSGKTTTKKMASGGKADPVNTYSAARAKAMTPTRYATPKDERIAKETKMSLGPMTAKQLVSSMGAGYMGRGGRNIVDTSPATQQKIADYKARKTARQAAFAQTDAGKAQAQTQAAARTQQRAQDVANARAQSAKMLSGGMKKGGKAKAKKK